MDADQEIDSIETSTHSIPDNAEEALLRALLRRNLRKLRGARHQAPGSPPLGIDCRRKFEQDWVGVGKPMVFHIVVEPKQVRDDTDRGIRLTTLMVFSATSLFSLMIENLLHTGGGEIDGKIHEFEPWHDSMICLSDRRRNDNRFFGWKMFYKCLR